MSLERHLTLSQITELLALAPTGTSQYEFNTFVATENLGRARKLRAVLTEIVQMEKELAKSKSYVDLAEEMKIPCIDNHVETTQRLTSELNVRYNWLKTKELSAIQKSLSNFESEEAEYWINTIATQSAIDVLTGGKMSEDTMKKMMAVEREDFYQIIFRATKIANKVKSMMVDAEKQIEGELVK